MNQGTNQKEELKPYNLRIPADLKSVLEEKAALEKRSLNAQIVLVLENYVNENPVPRSPLKLAA